MTDDDSTSGSKDEEPFGKFDDTNGLAGDLDGDDGGAENPDVGEPLSIIPNLLGDPDSDFHDDSNETGYSSEGAE